MQGGPSLCDRLGPRTQPGPRSSTTSPNPSDGLFVVMTALRQIADHSRLPDGGHGRGVSSLPLPAGEPLHFCHSPRQKHAHLPGELHPTKPRLPMIPCANRKPIPIGVAASYKSSYRECAGGRPLFRSLGKRRRRTPDTTERTSRERSPGRSLMEATSRVFRT